MEGTETKNFFEIVEEYERKLIGEALAQANGNQARAARMLGLKPTTLNSQI
jgi:transcriptional regulator with GAF, ATPase, and Fis domain